MKRATKLNAPSDANIKHHYLFKSRFNILILRKVLKVFPFLRRSEKKFCILNWSYFMNGFSYSIPYVSRNK